jgi:DNA-binding NarL/FixJ family response regulator
MGGIRHFRAGPRQRQVLALVARGKKDAAIASELGVSIATVRTYLSRLYRDNGLSNRAQAVALWMAVSAAVDIESFADLANRLSQ